MRTFMKVYKCKRIDYKFKAVFLRFFEKKKKK